jgi:hypothetical protein
MLLCIYRAIPHPPPRTGLKPNISWTGFLYGSLGLSLIFGALDQGERLNWLGSGVIVGMLVTGAFFILAAAIRRWMSPNPLVNLPFLKNRNTLILGAALFSFRFVLLAIALLIPAYLGAIQGYRPLETGRVLLWVGVLLTTAGVGLLVRQHIDRVGPLAIAITIGAAAAACLGWAWRRAPTSSFAFDSVLLLGALLAASDLAFIEVKFTALGPHWPWHLLIVAAAYAGLAFRFDSKTLFSLSLTSFAAWRGVSIAGVATPWGTVSEDDRLLVEALVCGVLFLAIGKLL